MKLVLSSRVVSKHKPWLFMCPGNETISKTVNGSSFAVHVRRLDPLYFLCRHVCVVRCVHNLFAYSVCTVCVRATFSVVHFKQCPPPIPRRLLTNNNIQFNPIQIWSHSRLFSYTIVKEPRHRRPNINNLAFSGWEREMAKLSNFRLFERIKSEVEKKYCFAIILYTNTYTSAHTHSAFVEHTCIFGADLQTCVKKILEW